MAKSKSSKRALSEPPFMVLVKAIVKAREDLLGDGANNLLAICDDLFDALDTVDPKRKLWKPSR